MAGALRAVLFDVDGTLTDSADLIKKTIAGVMRRNTGGDWPDHAFSRYVGPPLEDTFADLGVPPEKIDDYIDDYRQHYHAIMETTALFAGIPKLLSDVKAHGLATVTATTKGEESAREILSITGIDHFFDAIAGSETATGRTHKHQVVDRALTLLEQAQLLDAGNRYPVMPLGTRWDERQTRTDVVMVGDRDFDTDGAAVHGIRTILVDWGEGSAQEHANAWRHVHTIEELTSLLVSL
ncbi:HAD hydrolase-like protein [Arcanobacterium pinnipediorum]|uniref:HAD hydrolase-like protein n=1 Tax=Arcanobacterium pinnipediorum TaxID=1503041 RepID=A0ABY5AIM8_9ACTO|nr:HAD hydrolase-like protein [Arcanobacterium pinnipediorum]USR80072.1 HAD hydrolase-like protein [Arcanobacterium pinnipediorum]